jgi:threonyl-tRNA synthetase
VQVVLLPIADRHVPYASSVRQRLADAGFRAQVDERQEKIGYKIREAQLQKIPYMLVVGDREAAEGTVAVRSRSGGDHGSQPLDAFMASAREEVEKKGSQLSAISSQQLEARKH